MGPSCRKRTKNPRRRRRRRCRRTTLLKKHLQATRNIQDDSSMDSPPAASPVRPFAGADTSKHDVEIDKFIECSTPKGERSRIPEIRTCPPAPKKRRTIASCSLRRAPIAFFAPPDIELFFHFALRGIPV